MSSTSKTFYGMNVSLPGGVETGVSTFLGEFTTFIMMLAAAAGALGMTLYFRRLGWI